MARRKGRRKKRYTQVERIAYQMGKVQCGLKNPNSKIYASYQKGCDVKKKPNRKPLY